MNIFVVGLPKSGRTTFAKSLAEQLGFVYIDIISWVFHTFRDKNNDETARQYQDARADYILERLRKDPSLLYRNIMDAMSCQSSTNFIIDGCLNPKDFTTIFNYNEDFVVFLNRLDNESEYKDYENIALSTIKDYCYWLSSAKLISREKWLEFNFPMAGNDTSGLVKELGNHNKVLICKSFQSVLNYVVKLLKS